MFYSESILNRSVKSFLLTLSLFSYELYGALPAAAAPAGAAGTLVMKERPQQFKRAQPLPSFGLPGQIAYASVFGGFAGVTAWHVLAQKPVFDATVSLLSSFGQLHRTAPQDIVFGGSLIFGVGAGIATLINSRRSQQRENKLIQERNTFENQVEAVEHRLRAIEQRQEQQEAGTRALQTGQDNLGMQVDNLARQVGAGFTAVEQARAADTQALQQQAAAHHQENQERFGDLQKQLDALPGATVQAFLTALDQQRQQQRALPTDEDAASAAEVRPLHVRRALPWEVPFAVYPMQAFMRQQQPMADNPADSTQLKAADEVE